MTTTIHPDAALYEMIARVAELWAMTPPLDEQAVALWRAGKRLEAKEIDDQRSRLVSETADLEFTIAYANVQTTEGHAAKISAIVAADFDLEDLVGIAYRLGHEAARLGLHGDVPDLKPALAAAA
jgi:hypothetical protein